MHKTAWSCLLRGTYAECVATSNSIVRTQGEMLLCAAQEARGTSSLHVKDKSYCMVFLFFTFLRK